LTTLYFETFEEDGLHNNGFSKDNKAQQLQIEIGFMESKEGLPIAHEVSQIAHLKTIPSYQLLKGLSLL
jgi:transposase